MMFDIRTGRGREARTGAWVALAWAAALGAALLLDGPVARAVAPWRGAVKHSTLAEEIKEGGHAGVTVVAVLLLVALHPHGWRAASLLVGSALVAGVMRSGIALAAGRVRPVSEVNPFSFFHFEFGVGGILHAHNLSFPSGHATLAFVMAYALSHALGKGRWLFFSGAALVGVERVAESAHYLSDIVAAALVATIAFRLALRLHTRLWEEIDRRRRPQLIMT
jgi:membrane-associated phospholipid phosphatase